MEAFINLSAGGLIYEGPRSMVQFVIQSTEMILKDPKYLVVEITLYESLIALAANNITICNPELYIYEEQT